MMLELDKIYNMDCIEGMKQLDNNSIDMILCDLPYGVTQCKWDKPLPSDKLWNEYKRIINNGAIILTACYPYVIDLINSNRDWFKYEWIWYKNLRTGFMNASKQPIKAHENILVFHNGISKYYPQKVIRKTQKAGNVKPHITEQYGLATNSKKQTNFIYPHDVIEIDCIHGNNKRYHPSQKPLKLFEYLIKTYSNEGDLVLDNCMGSGTTAVACKRLGRRFIGFEIDKEFCDIADKRLKNVPKRLETFKLKIQGE